MNFVGPWAIENWRACLLLARLGSHPGQPAGPVTGVLLPRKSVAGRAEFDPELPSAAPGFCNALTPSISASRSTAIME
jgi:hypothetical protein